MKIAVLIDNLPHPEREDLQAEHGLSFFIEAEGRKILCDMGASAAFMANAERLGLEVSETDLAFLSHGHADHSGGLGFFLQMNATAPVVLSPSVFRQKYYSSRRGAKRDISTEACLLSVYPQRFVPVTESCWLEKRIAVVRNVVDCCPKPVGNAFLTMEELGDERPDRFEHELSLAFCTPEGLVVVSACSHHGALNIIESCRRFTGVEKVTAFVGGLHFVDGDEAVEEAKAFVKQWKELYPEMRLYTGHCTGTMAKEVLSQVDGATCFHTGMEFSPCQTK